MFDFSPFCLTRETPGLAPAPLTKQPSLADANASFFFVPPPPTGQRQILGLLPHSKQLFPLFDGSLKRSGSLERTSLEASPRTGHKHSGGGGWQGLVFLGTQEQLSTAPSPPPAAATPPGALSRLDQLDSRNLSQQFSSEVQIPEARAFYGFQIAMAPRPGKRGGKEGGGTGGKWGGGGKQIHAVALAWFFWVSGEPWEGDLGWWCGVKERIRPFFFGSGSPEGGRLEEATGSGPWDLGLERVVQRFGFSSGQVWGQKCSFNLLLFGEEHHSVCR